MSDGRWAIVWHSVSNLAVLIAIPKQNSQKSGGIYSMTAARITITECISFLTLMFIAGILSISTCQAEGETSRDASYCQTHETARIDIQSVSFTHMKHYYNKLPKFIFRFIRIWGNLVECLRQNQNIVIMRVNSKKLPQIATL